MAFESLSEKLNSTFKKLRGKGVLGEKDIDEAMREIRLALLEADVNYKVVKDFVAGVKEKALGEEVLNSLTPGQQVIKIVNDEMIALLGGVSGKLSYSPSGFTTIMLVGLQGTGKTTTAGKLAAYLLKEGKKPMLAACDVQRPAAIDQLEIVGSQVGVPVYTDRECKDPAKIAVDAKKQAEIKGYNILIVDTAGRLHVDEELMDELKRVRKEVKPFQILLVVDAMTGQDAVNSASAFNDAMGVDGIIMTKLDGDTRGGAALSVKSVTGKPILFAGMGEKLEALEPFHPDRMAGRILGMGDMLSLIEKVSEAADEEKARELEKRMSQNKFTLDDLLEQMRQLKSMGGIGKFLEMLPGGTNATDEQLDKSEIELRRSEAIICSMTKKEKEDPRILDASRRKRIAAGAGVSVTHVNQLIKKFEETKKMMKQMNNMKGKKGFGRRGFPGF
ncbi:MAG: signal recognition particle protein [Firmicutes bacterium]|nr:signal recognition particle protein [Bacillota bacterium]